MALLLYSRKCKHSMEIIDFIQQNQQLRQIVRFHDVNSQGIPQQYSNKITRVPTMLTQNGKFLVGAEIKQWLLSLLPNQEWDNHGFGGIKFASNLDGEEDGGLFSLNNYGQSLQPALTPELQAKIDKGVSEAYKEYQK
jgi:hypothetical protein